MPDSALILLPQALVTVNGTSIPCVVGTKSGSDSPSRAAFNTLVRTNAGQLVIVPTAGWSI